MKLYNTKKNVRIESARKLYQDPMANSSRYYKN